MNKFPILINWPHHALLHQKAWYIAGSCVCRRGRKGGDEEVLISCLCGCRVKKRTALLEAALCSLQSDAAALQYYCMCVSQNSKVPHINISAWATPNCWCIVVYNNWPLLSSGVLFDFVLVFVKRSGVFAPSDCSRLFKMERFWWSH